jgi:hypothetical protein
VEQRLYNKIYNSNKNDKAMELILESLVLILCKKVPPECDVKKIERLHDKVKLLNLPAAAKEPKPQSAVVRLSIAVQDDQELEQENKGVAINGRPTTLPYSVIVLNQYASRVAREEFVIAIERKLPEFFKDESVAKKILK